MVPSAERSFPPINSTVSLLDSLRGLLELEDSQAEISNPHMHSSNDVLGDSVMALCFKHIQYSFRICMPYRSSPIMMNWKL